MYVKEDIENKIIYGDNLDEMRKIPSDFVDLIYLDPPFFTQQNWTKNGNSFSDKFKDMEEYINFMSIRLKEMYRILKQSGTIYLHCDYHASHYLKIEMDKIFGYDNFQNEIVWSYSGGGVPKTAFPRKHDILLFYSKTNSKDRVFNIQYKPYAETTSCHTGGSPLNEKGTPITDSWEDLRGMSLVSKEKLGYPTQKPEKLLRRVILASSNPGDIVLDPFCGSGTTCIVAKKLSRNYIGIDNSEDAVKLSEQRLKEIIIKKSLFED